MRRALWTLLVATTLIPGAAGCTAYGPPPAPATGAAPVGQEPVAPPIVGAWRMTINGAADGPTLFSFLRGGALITADGGVGAWRLVHTDTYEGRFELVVEGTTNLIVTFTITVLDDSLAGDGTAELSTGSEGAQHVSLTGSRVRFPSAVGARAATPVPTP